MKILFRKKVEAATGKLLMNLLEILEWIWSLLRLVLKIRLNLIQSNQKFSWKCTGGGQHLEQPNVERPIFRNLENLDIKRMADELFVFWRFFFIFIIFLKYMEIYGISGFENGKILKICFFFKLNNFMNLMIFEIVKFGKFLEFFKLKILGIFRKWTIRLIWLFLKLKFWEILEFSKMGIYEILCIWNFSKLKNCKFFRIFLIECFWNFLRWAFLRFSKLQNFWIF